MTNHLGLDLDLVELFARIDADDTANHLGHDNHVPQVRLDEVWLLVGLGLLLGLTQFLDQAHGLALQTTVEPAAGAGVHDIAELVGGEIEESVDVQRNIGLAHVLPFEFLGIPPGMWIWRGAYWSRSMPR